MDLPNGIIDQILYLLDTKNSINFLSVNKLLAKYYHLFRTNWHIFSNCFLELHYRYLIYVPDKISLTELNGYRKYFVNKNLNIKKSIRYILGKTVLQIYYYEIGKMPNMYINQLRISDVPNNAIISNINCNTLEIRTRVSTIKFINCFAKKIMVFGKNVTLEGIDLSNLEIMNSNTIGKYNSSFCGYLIDSNIYNIEDPINDLLSYSNSLALSSPSVSNNNIKFTQFKPNKREVIELDITDSVCEIRLSYSNNYVINNIEIIYVNFITLHSVFWYHDRNEDNLIEIYNSIIDTIDIADACSTKFAFYNCKIKRIICRCDFNDDDIRHGILSLTNCDAYHVHYHGSVLNLKNTKITCLETSFDTQIMLDNSEITYLNLYHCLYRGKNGTQEFIKDEEKIYRISCKYVYITFEDCECKIKLKLIFDNCVLLTTEMLLKNLYCKPKYIRYPNYDKSEEYYFPKKFTKKSKICNISENYITRKVIF